jgi:hypothetical protein
MSPPSFITALLCCLVTSLSAAPMARAARQESPLPAAPLLAAPPTDGWQQAPRHRLLLGVLVGARLNPIGLEAQLRMGYQLRLHDREKPLYRDNFVFLGLYPRINPASVKLGPSIELQPLSVFNLRLGAEYANYFSSFGALQSFLSPLDAYSDRALLDGQERQRNYATHGAHVVIEPTLQGKLGPVALRNKLSIEYWRMQLRDGDRVFYEATYDTLLSRSGWLLTDDLDLLVFVGPALVLGFRYSMVKPLYRAADFQPGDAIPQEDNAHHRVGPALAYTFFDRSGRRFNKPTLVLLLAWYLDHRYRTGGAETAIVPRQFVSSAGLPYVVLAFSFQLDLLPMRRSPITPGMPLASSGGAERKRDS